MDELHELDELDPSNATDHANLPKIVVKPDETGRVPAWVQRSPSTLTCHPNHPNTSQMLRCPGRIRPRSAHFDTGLASLTLGVGGARPVPSSAVLVADEGTRTVVSL